jgi:hypothetical protein
MNPYWLLVERIARRSDTAGSRRSTRMALTPSGTTMPLLGHWNHEAILAKGRSYINAQALRNPKNSRIFKIA